MLLRIFVFDSLCDPITNSRRRSKGCYQDCYLSVSYVCWHCIVYYWWYAMRKPISDKHSFQQWLWFFQFFFTISLQFLLFPLPTLVYFSPQKLFFPAARFTQNEFLYFQKKRLEMVDNIDFYTLIQKWREGKFECKTAFSEAGRDFLKWVRFWMGN